MDRIKKAIAFSVLVAAILAPCRSDAIVSEAISVGAPVSDVVNQLSARASEILRQLEGAVGISQFRIRQSILVIQDEIAYSVKEIEGKTFADLNNAQHKFFLGVESALNEASRATSAPLDQLQGISSTVEQAVARLPLSDNSPRVRQVKPSYMLARDTEHEFNLKVSGGELNSGEAQLMLGGQQCRSDVRTDTELQFRCSIPVLTDKNEITPLVGDLLVPLPRGFWARILGRKKEYKSYRVLVQMIPKNMGTFTVSATQATTRVETASRTGQVNAGNDHCAGSGRHGPFIFSVLGGPGFTIVPGSIRPGGEISGNQQRNLVGPLDVTSHGFAYYVDLRNGGTCVRVGGTTISHDARAWLHQNIHWDEQRTVAGEVTSTVMEGALAWEKDRPVPLPEGTKSWQVHIRQIDGTELVTLGADNSRKWFRVDVDGTGRNIVIRPRSVEDAMR